MCLPVNVVLIITIFRVSGGKFDSVSKQEGRRSALLPGDFIFGALYSVHHQPKQKRTDPSNILKCGAIREMYGIQRIEVTFQTLDRINNNPNILPNITLGVEIRDSCWYAPVALQQSIELIRDSISPNRQTTGSTCAAQFQGKKTDVNIGTSPSNVKKPLIGVIGPGSSSVALQVQNLLQLFEIPQVGYSTTSKDLSDKSRFNYFLRVVPSDYYQAQVMVDIVKRFNWTYVSAVNTDENYGQSGIQAFRELAERSDVCIAKEDSILSNADDEDFDDVIKNLIQDTSAQVVVCFCEGMTVRGLLKATQRLNATGKLILIGSDGWADRHDVTDDLEPEAHGSLSIRIHSPYVHSFDSYYFALRPETNLRNPWFKEFWQNKFGCEFLHETLQAQSQSHGTVIDRRSTHQPDENIVLYKSIEMDSVTEISESESTISMDNRRFCTGKEQLNDKYKQDPKLSFVIKAIYTLAYGLHSMQQDLCGRSTVGICSQMYPFNGSLFKSYLLNVSFSYEDGDTVEFDSRGDPPGRYDIMNYQQNDDGTYDYIQVGDWINGTLSFNRNLQFGAKRGLTVPESVCSRPCEPGYFKNFQKGGQDKRCCWVCVQCRPNEILANETSCSKCPPGTWPDIHKSHCNQIPVEFVQWTDTQAIVAIVFSCLGFLTTAFGCLVFVRYNNTPVVKSSTRELSYLILAGMTLSYATTFPIISQPTTITCSLNRTLPGISFAMIYASLLTKTNRIARILAGSKKRFPSRKLRFMSGTSQVLITCFLIGLEVGFSITMLVYEPPAPTFQFPTLDRVMLVCNTTPTGVLAPLAFDFLLIILCTVYALKTRNVPENFNEAKFIGFAMYTTCVIWVAFVPIYFGSETKIITMCVCVTLSAMVTFAFLFIPKLYIILLRPERNNRALFTTSKSIRCHIGSRVASALSEKSSFSSSGFQETAGKLDHDQNTNQQNPLQQINSSKLHVNWKDRSSHKGNKEESIQAIKKPEMRTLSCQTGKELLQLLLQTQVLPSTTKQNPNQILSPRKKSDLETSKWQELSPSALVKLCTFSPSTIRHRATTMCTPKMTRKSRIREESISDASLSDNDSSCQMKNITISLGSLSSVQSQAVGHQLQNFSSAPCNNYNNINRSLTCLDEAVSNGRSITPISFKN